jgi:hypothetical protein
MAKPLGPKSKLIRQAIGENPAKGNTALADMLNGARERKADKIKVTADDVAKQRQALKKLGGAKAPAATPAGNGRRKPGPRPAAALRASAALPAGDAVELIDQALDLARRCGGMAALKRLVDRLADVPR